MRLASLTMGLLAALVGGCSSGGSGGGTEDSGEVVIGLTDAEGDFVRYSVEVVSIQLTKANGALVETLPLATPVDFAELTEITEFLTAATIPSGLYTHATMMLDYSQADIWVEDAGGEPVSTEPRDSSGEPIDLLEVTVQLDDRRALLIVPGVPAHLTLDFDLAATNDVDTTQDPPVVTVHPLLVAEVNPERPKVHRVRGPLVSADAGDGTFVIAIRPFRGLVRDFGRLTVATVEETVYEVNGQSAAGDAGFALLAAEPVGTAVVALGDFDPATRVFTAREVYAGSSVPGGGLDALTGTVVARAGDTLTVRAATLDRSQAALFLARDLTVTLSEDTTVTRQAHGGDAFTSDDVSVGQWITALGVYAEETETFDASAGHVRMLLTRISGTVLEKEVGEVDVTLQHIQGIRVVNFDFEGTGVDAENDADPDAFTVDTGPMSLASLEVGDPVRVFGFPAAFGGAPPDFEAQSVVDASAAVARLLINWSALSTDNLVVDQAAQQLTLDVAGADLLHHVFRAGIPVELDAEPAPTVVPDEPLRGVFAIRSRGFTAIYTQFDDFSAALDEELAEGAEGAHLSGLGDFDAATQAFTARKIVVRLR
jgi:hypothetical protein